MPGIWREAQPPWQATTGRTHLQSVCRCARGVEVARPHRGLDDLGECLGAKSQGIDLEQSKSRCEGLLVVALGIFNNHQRQVPELLRGAQAEAWAPLAHHCACDFSNFSLATLPGQEFDAVGAPILIARRTVQAFGFGM